ncbi:WXG100 family type VII secretion target [Pseudoclavibacter alba]|uniref:WXG100 family type VII secretion target n=1 Tax=Pseudoclavibacter albus TaxID=272241 RepID=A0ABT2HU76_9MICO|nr:WXG100 family type VII secretion target [Pseudoclavibacter alba]MBN6778193.1 WXG100 family type VII secretion target [Pseudoclavibacter alba]MCT2041875.1 WXG100 family type VII secretion target [Pseudoclavibacter alba]
MFGMSGGDPVDMMRVAGVIDMQRGEVETARDQLQEKVDSLIPDIWNGPDADKFVEEFASEIRPKFDSVIQEMEQAAIELREQAAQQAATSLI